MLVRDMLGVCSFANVILDSKNDAFFASSPVYLRHRGITDRSVLRRFGNCHIKEIFYDDNFTILI